ncbi:hypothetical protein, partial [Pseudomonas sp. Irchel 3F5]|uniref:hypothetical protein n=1 Tax=Pseudomonas sp. Irchel 3F5 TaxID=2009002 RepID=UPI001C444EE6
AAFGGHSVNSDRGMGFIQSAEKLKGDVIAAFIRMILIHGVLGYCPLVTSASAIRLVHLGR